MSAKILNIEIGERIIKVCGTNPGKASVRVTNCVMIQTPPGAVNDGEIVNPEAVAAALKENLTKNGLRTKKVIFSLVSGRIATREVTTPPVKDNRLKAIVEAGANDYFPVDMSKYHITYSLLERKQTGEDAGCKLIVMAAPLSVLEGYFRVASILGLQVVTIDYSGNSQFRLLESAPVNEVTMYVDVDCTFSITTVMRQGKLLMQRTFNSGVDDLVTAYQNVTRKTEGEYVTALGELYTLQTTDDSESILPQRDIKEGLSRLVSNIARIVDYFNSTNWETPIEKLVLTGCGAPVSGLREVVAEATGMPVDILSKMDSVSAPGTLTSQIVKYTNCIGSAFSPVDFMPEQFSKTKKKETTKKQSASTGILIFVGCLVAAAAIGVTSYFRYTNDDSQKQQLTKDIAQLEPADNVYKAYTAYNKYVSDTQALSKLIKTPNDSLLNFISELEQKLPTQVDIQSAVCTVNGITMNLMTDSKEAAAKTIVQLRTFKSISNIEVGPVTEATNAQGLLQVTFSVNCSYVDAPKKADAKTNTTAGAAASGAAASGTTTTGTTAAAASASPSPSPAK